jgi:hypothetical protein
MTPRSLFSSSRAHTPKWALLAVVLASCTTTGFGKLPPPPPTLAPQPTTTLPDLSLLDLRSVPGRTTTTVVFGPGRASITGIVTGPEGPVAGAVVRVERLVGDGHAVGDLVTDATGSYALAGVLGGRYRLRAFKPAPDNLALVKPALLFLSGDEARKQDLAVDRYAGLDVTSAIAPNPPIIDEPANLVIRLTERSVDGDGVVRGTPIPGRRVELFASGSWRVDGANATVTDGAGQASWQVRCQALGQQALAVVVGDSDSFPLSVGACSEAPPPTTAPPPTSSTSSSTPTTVRRSTTTTVRSSTTSTTRPTSTTSTTVRRRR